MKSLKTLTFCKESPMFSIVGRIMGKEAAMGFI